MWVGVIRVILAIYVAIYHANPNLSIYFMDGLTAVNLFFIISGFYMAFIWNEKYALKKHGLKDFYLNRFFRIFPLYWVILFASLFTYYVMYFYFHTGVLTKEPLVYGFLYRNVSGVIGDITLLGRLDYWNIDALRNNGPFIGAAWSLVVELLFYIFFSVLCYTGVENFRRMDYIKWFN